MNGLEVDVLEIVLVDRAGKREQMIHPVAPGKRREIARNELDRHVLLRIGNAAPQNSLDERCSTQDAARCAKSELGRASLHLSDVACGDLGEGWSVDENQLLDALRAGRGE